MTLEYIIKIIIIGSIDGLSPGRCQAIIWNIVEILLIGPLGTNFSEILIKIHIFSFKKIYLKMSSAKWQPICLCLNVLRVKSLRPGDDKFLKRNAWMINETFFNRFSDKKMHLKKLSAKRLIKYQPHGHCLEDVLTHCGRVTYTCARNLNHRWLMACHLFGAKQLSDPILQHC